MKVYRMGDKIEIEELQEVARGIMKKAIKVIASNGDKVALEMQEGKYKDLQEDLLQEVAMQLILNDYIISKECYKIVRKYIYRKNRDIIELIINSDIENDVQLLNNDSYIKYINAEYKTEKRTSNFNIDSLGLTDNQKNIIEIYAKTNSLKQTADVLGVSKSTISNTIYRLRDKLEYLKVAVIV